MAVPVLMIAQMPLSQWSQATKLPNVAAGQAFWAQDYQVAMLTAAGQAAVAPAGTPPPPPEPPLTVNMVPGLGAAVSNCSPAPLPRRSVSVSAAETGNPANTGILLRVRVLTGAAVQQAGATGTARAQTVVVNTTTPGSVLYGAIVDNSEHNGFAWLASTSPFDNNGDPQLNASYGSFRSASSTGPAGPVTIGTTDTGTADRALAVAEILPAQGAVIAEDASSPAPVFLNTGSSATTAAFSPPHGSTLVAMVSAEGGLGPIGMALSGGGLTWAQQVVLNPGVVGYVGVWTALVIP